MSFTHRLQGSRFELKYLISEATARGVRDFALSYLVPDPHADPARNCEYPVHSLYLDSRRLELCRATLRGLKDRYKLRVRFYDDLPESPCFAEVKRRQNDVILKQRAPLRRSAIPRLLAGHWPLPEDIMDVSPRGMGALSQFCRLQAMIQAEGQVFVSYVREAYVTPSDDSVRLTFDRRIHCVRYDGGGTLAMKAEKIYPRIEGVVLEIKFTNRFPVWMRLMARHFDLDRRSMAKYVACMCAQRLPQLELMAN
ncbi:MAG: polyphosphate polymerase domain-containing protein [Planctomycetes bacterium]|nr:polyphosphate polymerase domain-containing protein [Planctomycetota bacterium]